MIEKEHMHQSGRFGRDFNLVRRREITLLADHVAPFIAE
jgi:hypothetical protein